MRLQLRTPGQRRTAPAAESALDLVVPFTTTHLTQAALDAANRLGAGLNAAIRLVRIQVVPFPMDLEQSPVAADFIARELSGFVSELAIRPEVRLARDTAEGLKGALQKATVVVLACHKGLWRTREELLAANLRRAGYHVVVVRTKPDTATPRRD